MKNFNLIMTFVLLAVLICVIFRNNIENFQTNQVALNNATLSYGNVPPGTIVSWCHDAEFRAGRLSTDNTANIPDGWVVCDGRSYTKTDGSGTGNTPNLVGKFIYGGKGQNYANVNRPSNNTGEYRDGNAFYVGRDMYLDNGNSYPAIMNIGGIDKVTLTNLEMPSHNHRITGSFNINRWGRREGGSRWNSHFGTIQYGTTATWDQDSNAVTLGSDNTGSGRSHENMPPYYTLVYIMKKY